MAQPGVVNVGAVSRLPFSGKNLGTWVFVEGRDTPGSPGVEVEYRVATRELLRHDGHPPALRAPLR